MQSDLSFRMMSFEFRIRDFFRPPARILREAGIREGLTVLDFGCGPGGFSLAAARLVGPQGRVYALDHHPLAARSVRKSAGRRGLGNIRSVFGTGLADLPGESVDLTLVYDVLHDLPEPGPVLSGLHRVLKPGGVLSVSDHHLKKEPLVSLITGAGLFLFAGGTRRTFQFHKKETSGAVS
jgi:ubiquinone/menaquinone biosynthesis C-methylase UbiE